jgi:chromosomal replication initiator protein
LIKTSRLIEGSGGYTIASAKLLNPNYTFDKFVTGVTNESVHSAAKSFAEGHESHPLLFIHGASSTGKTHLLHGIEHRIKQNPTVEVRCITAESFGNVMRDHERKENLKGFRNGICKIDVLLIDDLQFLQTRRFAQGEFLHTLNMFCELGKRMAVASTLPSQELAFSESLQEKLGSGLIVEIEPPDEEITIEILKRHAAQLDFAVPREIIESLASSEFTVRQVLGSLITLIEHCRLKGERPTTSLLEKLTDVQSTKWDFNRLRYKIARHFRLNPARLNEKNKAQFIEEPRQILCYLASEAGIPVSEISRELNKTSHTVLGSIKQITEQRKTDSGLEELLTTLAEQIDG